MSSSSARLTYTVTNRLSEHYQNKLNKRKTSLDWTLLNLFSSLYHCGLNPPPLLFSLLWCDCSAFIQNSRSSTLNFFPATQTVGREGEGWGNDGHYGLLLFTPCHSVLSYPGSRVKLDT